MTSLLAAVAHKLIERLEKCLDLTENPAVRKDSLSSKNVEKKRGRKRKATTGESSKNKQSWLQMAMTCRCIILLIENKWYCYRTNNETIDYTLICNDKQEIVLNKNCHHLRVRNKEVKFVWIFSLGPRFHVRCPYYRGSVLVMVIGLSGVKFGL